MKRVFFFLCFSFFSVCVFAQDVSYARSIIDSLSSPHMHGRGYVNNGQAIAAGFIANEFSKDSLKYFGSSYFQNFTLSLCTLPDTVELRIAKRKMKPGIDFLVAPSSISVKGKFKVLTFDSVTLVNKKAFQKFMSNDLSGKFVFIDKNDFHDKRKITIIDSAIDHNLFGAKGIIVVGNKLVWGVDDALYPSAWENVTLLKKNAPKKIRKISINVRRVINPNFQMKNVVGYVRGCTKPDSFIVFTAHYDHLGQMGKDVYFPGANDNASGTAMMLDLAKYYAKNKPVYSMVFIATTGEELGLKGSTYFVKHPLFPLSNIRFLINLDLEGTGDDGVKVVNGSIFKNEFDTLVSINNEKKYLKAVSPRGKAAISDHYPFYAEGVKSFYIYALGGYTEYHNIYDISETLSLSKYNEIFDLVKDFVSTFK